MCKTKYKATDKTKVICVHPPRKPIWRGWLKPKEALAKAFGQKVEDLWK